MHYQCKTGLKLMVEFLNLLKTVPVTIPVTSYSLKHLQSKEFQLSKTENEHFILFKGVLGG